MRPLSAGAIAAIAADRVTVALLVEMLLSGGNLFLNHSRLDLVVNGQTYLGSHGLGQVGEVANTSSEMPKLQFSMSGAPSDKIALALTEPVRGKPVRVKAALFDTGTGAVLDVMSLYAGWLDLMSISDGRDSGATLVVTSESGTRDLLRPCNVLYTHADQLLLVDGDMAFQFQSAQVEQKILFPALTWFQKHRG